jgi:hypothetical protein
MIDLKNLNAAYFEQLSLGLDVDELEDGNGQTVFTTEEKERRSMGARVALETLYLADGEHARDIAWYETYQKLVQSKWPWRIACFVAWASTPKVNRWPKTQDELARQVLGLTSDRVIATWRKKNPDIDGAISLLQSAPMLEHRADVIQALVQSASSADHRSNPDRKLFFEMTGDYVPRSRVDVKAGVDGEDLSTLSDAELMEIARRARRTVSEGDEPEDNEGDGDGA